MGRPKGSKNKSTIKREKVPIQTSEEQTPTPDLCCKICQRVLWGNYVYLGNGKYRHSECALGSEEWLYYYSQLSKAEQEPLKEFHQLAYKQTLEEYNATS